MGNKNAVGILGLVAGIVGLGVLFRSQKAQASGNSGPGSIAIKIIPAAPRVAGRYAAAVGSNLVEGSTGNTALITLTNNTVYTGTTTKAPYTFTLVARIMVGSTKVLEASQVVAMGAGETKTVSFSFNVPYGANGSGIANASLFDNTGTQSLATSSPIGLTVSPASVTPAGTISY